MRGTEGLGNRTNEAGELENGGGPGNRTEKNKGGHFYIGETGLSVELSFPLYLYTMVAFKSVKNRFCQIEFNL